jgi:hypothetical protein
MTLPEELLFYTFAKGSLITSASTCVLALVVKEPLADTLEIWLLFWCLVHLRIHQRCQLTCVVKAASHLPLVSKGAIDHVSWLLATLGTTAFTPCRHLGFGTPDGITNDIQSSPTSSTHPLTTKDLGLRVGLPEGDVLGYASMVAKCFVGLEPSSLDSTGGFVTSAVTSQHRIENKHSQMAHLAIQTPKTQWEICQGEFDPPPPPHGLLRVTIAEKCALLT